MINYFGCIITKEKLKYNENLSPILHWDKVEIRIKKLCHFITKQAIYIMIAKYSKKLVAVVPPDDSKAGDQSFNSFLFLSVRSLR